MPPRRSPTAFCQLSSSIGRVVQEEEVDEVGNLSQHRHPLLGTSASAANTAASKRSGGQGGGSVAGAPVSGSRQAPGAHSPATGSTHGRAAVDERGTGRARM